LLIHVMDSSAGDLDDREGAVLKVLEEIGAGDRPRIDVLTKRDLIPAERAEGLLAGRPEAVLVSAKDGTGLDELGRALVERLELSPRQVRLRFAVGDARGIAGIYTAGRVVSHEVHGSD